MKIKLIGNETLSAGPQVAGASIDITAANADECYALALTNKATLIDDNPISSSPGDVGAALASLVAKQPGVLSLSSASPSVGAAPGSLIARVMTDMVGAITLDDNGGGRVALQGRSLVSTSTPFQAGNPVPIKLSIGGSSRTFTLYPAARKGGPVADQNRWLFWSTRSRFPSGALVVAAADTPYKMSRIVFASPSYPKRNPRFHFSGFASTEGGNSPQETVLPGNAVIIDGFWVSVNGGPWVQQTFGGQTTATIASGSTGIWTDEPNIPIPAEASVATHTLYHTASAENQIPVYRIQTQRGERIWGATDAASLMAMLTNPATPSTASLDTGFGQNQPAYYGPDMTIAKGWDGRPVALGVVDSIGEQRQEFAAEADARGNLGWFRKWLDQPDAANGRVPHFMMGMPGLKSTLELSTNSLLRWQILDQANAMNGDGSLVWTRPVWQLGQNDLQSTYAATQTAYTGLLDRFAARYPTSPKPVGVGVFPRTTSTDQHTTRASQTPSTGNEWAYGATPWGAGIKYQLEAYKQAGAGGRLAGYIDTRPAYLDPNPPAGQSPATWAPAFSTTLAAPAGTDGTATYSQISVVDKPFVGDLLYLPGGANFYISKVEGTGPYVLTTTTPISTVMATGAKVIARPTPEGVHLYTSYVAATVAAIPQSEKAKIAA